MKVQLLALLLLSCSIHTDQAATSSGDKTLFAGESKKIDLESVPAISNLQPLDPHQPISLAVHCDLFFKNLPENPGLAHLFSFKGGNFEEALGEKCRPYFQKGCSALTGKHLEEILEEWKDEETGLPIGNPRERFKQFLQAYCAKSFVYWDALKVEHYDLISDIDLIDIENWPNFDPDLLAYFETRLGYTLLPTPTLESEAGLARIMGHHAFRDGHRSLWLIFDNDMIKFVNNEDPKLLYGMTECLAAVGLAWQSESTPLTQGAADPQDKIRYLVWSLRTQVLINAILSSKKDSQLITNLVSKILEARKSARPLISSVYRSFGACMAISVFKNLRNYNEANSQSLGSLEQLVEFMEGGGAGQTNTEIDCNSITLARLYEESEMVAAAFEQSSEDKENIKQLQSQLLLDYISMYNVQSEHFRAIVAKDIKTAESLASNLLEELGCYVEEKRYEKNRDFPVNPFKICAEITQANREDDYCRKEFDAIFGTDQKARNAVLSWLQREQNFKCGHAIVKDSKDLKILHLRRLQTASVNPTINFQRAHNPIPRQSTSESSVLQAAPESPIVLPREESDVEFKLRVTREVFSVPEKIDLFIRSNMVMTIDSGIDQGGPLRGYLYEMLSLLAEPERKLTCEHRQYRKFCLFLSRDLGKFAGILAAKSIQQGVTLPFALDPRFYDLIIDVDSVNTAGDGKQVIDELMQKYFNMAYQEELVEMKKLIGISHGQEAYMHIKDCLQVPRTEQLTFTSFDRITNYPEPANQEQMYSEGHPPPDNGQDLYDAFYKAALAEFFELVVSFGHHFDKMFMVNGLNYLENRKTFYSVLNKESLLAEQFSKLVLQFITNINFEQHSQERVESAFQDLTITAKDCFASFILALEVEDFYAFFETFTGSRTAISPENVPNVKVNFSKLGLPKLTVTKADEDYIKVLRRVAMVQTMMEQSFSIEKIIQAIRENTLIQVAEDQITPFTQGDLSLPLSHTCSFSMDVPLVSTSQMVSALLYLKNSEPTIFYEVNFPNQAI